MRRGKKCARSSHGHTGITRHSPRNGFTVCFVLSPAIGLFCHRHPWETCFSRTWHQRRGVRTTRLGRPLAASPVSRAACVHRIPPRRPWRSRNAPPS